MKTQLVACLFSLVVIGAAQAQESPYHTRLATDLPVTAAGIGLSYWGLQLIKDKEGLSPAQAAALRKEDVNRFDRFSAGWYSETADKHSYYPFFASFAMPVVVLLNNKVNDKAGQVLCLYVETMAVTATLYTMAAGNIDRYRPYTYGSEASLAERTKGGATRSFYAGHTAATASATFFAAKVFSDFNPDSGAKPYIWTAAAVLPATVGYLRLRGGNHFLSDNLLGYGIGAATGILVPQLHKSSKAAGLSIVPSFGPGYQSASLSYRF